MDYRTLAESATPGTDYTDVSATLTFPESETRRTFTVPIINDFVGESSETVALVLTNETGGATLGAVPTATLTILNDDSGVGFTSATYTVNEGSVAGAVLISVNRLGATNGTARVNYTTVNGTAVAGQDYTAQSGLLTFDPGVTLQTFSVPIADDALIEPSETFVVNLSNLTGGAALSRDQATVTIVDNDFRAGVLTFSAPAYSVGEDDGSMTITVLRTNGSTGVLSVEYATVTGTASNGVDFATQSGLLVFPEGATSQTITITILDDGVVEGDEAFLVQLSNPSGTVIMGPSNVVVTIVDEESGPGSLDRSFDPGLGANDLVRTVALDASGRVLAGGAFTSMGGAPRNYLARLLADGANDPGFNPGAGPNGLVASVETTSDGRALFAGAFSEVDGVAFKYVSRVQTNGAVDLTFSPDAGFNGSVNVARLRSDGRSVVGGAFSLPARGVVRLRADGAVDTTFIPGLGLDGPAHAVWVLSDGRVLVAGAFALADGLARGRVARFNPDGSLDATFAPTAITSGTVYSMVVQAGGEVVVGGDFVTTAGTNSVRLARLNGDGSLDSAFNVGSGPNGVVFALGLNSSNQIVVGGNFTAINGVTRNRFARLQSDGRLDAAFDPGPGANGTVFALVVQPNNDIVIGGNFTMVSGAVRNRLARVLGGGVAFSPFATASAAGGQVCLTFSVQSGGRYRLEASANLVDWTPVATNQAVAATIHWTQPMAGGAKARFYRVRPMAP